MEKITGEGSKPIFNRKEILEGETALEERAVRYIDERQHIGRSSIEERREKDSRKLQSRRSSIEERRENDSRKLQSRKSSIEKYREYKEKYTERNTHKYNTNRSRERDSRKSHSRALMEERCREKRNTDRDRVREPMDVAPHMPIYYNLPPRSFGMRPMLPFRGQFHPPVRGQCYPVMAPVGPFSPQFIPDFYYSDIYRFGPPPPNPRYGSF